MKKIFAGLVFAGFALPLATPSAQAFSTSAQQYSKEAYTLILNSREVLASLPASEAITSIEQVSRSPYQFDVRAGACTVRVELSTSTPSHFIGNGFPHDPKVVDATGCQP